MVALILSCGGSPEPLIYSIKNINPDFVYFLCSNDSKEEVTNIIKESEFSKEYDVKIVNDHESLDESFAKSREIIKELEKDYDNIHIDFTGGTKPMVSGLVLAAIGENCSYSYVGTENSKGRDKNGLGIVQDGFEAIKEQKDPYDVFAVMEFEKGMDFFNRYQFDAAGINFQTASEKLESENLKELSNLYIELVNLYDLWDKFNNISSHKKTLNSILDKLLGKINSSNNLLTHLNEEYPNFIPQIEDNIEFLKLKISRKGVIKLTDVTYYLPDLLNNASRRITEGKYDDAVARLYRAIELIAQFGLTQNNLINEHTLRSHAKFTINKQSIIDLANDDVNEVVNDFNEYNNPGKAFGIGSKKSYQLLEALGSEFATEYLNDEDIENNIRLRNSSILAHGLQPVDKAEAEELYSQVLYYAKKAFPDVEKYMEMAEFPKFRND